MDSHTNRHKSISIDLNVFITGGTGFVGRHVITYLTSLTHPPRLTCLVRDPKKGGFIQALGGTILVGDLLDPSQYRDALHQADIVLHMGAKVGLKNGSAFYTVNGKGTHLLVNALAGSTVLKRLVFLSSIAAIDRDWTKPFDVPLDESSPICPTTDYGKSKRQAEALIETSGLPYTILRPAYIYGPYPRPQSSMDRLVHDMNAGKPYTFFPFPGRASEIYVEDLAKAIWIAARHEAARNEHFFVANPQPIRIHDFFQALAKELGVTRKAVIFSDTVLKRFQRYQFFKSPTDPMIHILYTDYFCCNPEKLFTQTGYQPSFRLEAGLEKTIDWYRTHGHL